MFEKLFTKTRLDKNLESDILTDFFKENSIFCEEYVKKFYSVSDNWIQNSLRGLQKPDGANPFAVYISLENIKHITKAMIKKEKEEKEIKFLDKSYSNLMDSVTFIDKYLVKVFSPKKRSLETIYYVFSSFTQTSVNYNKEYLRHPDIVKTGTQEQRRE